MFERLENLLIDEHKKVTEQRRFYIENGYCKERHESHHEQNDDGLRRYSTAKRWEQYKAGTITREKAVELATIRSNREREKDLCKELDNFWRVAAAPDLISVTISVSWARNRTWGYNPTAEIIVYSADGWAQYKGTASGCGYDKLTAAIGSALNQSDSVKKMLYATKENGLKYPPTQGRYVGGGLFDAPTSNHSLIHYGAGYGALPYFEGGVGMSSFYGVFEACGFVCAAQHETKLTNFYIFERKMEG